jgi:hypothetical protein
MNEIKKDLGKYSDDPDKYVVSLVKIGQFFDLIWWDVKLILAHTCINTEWGATFFRERTLKYWCHGWSVE